MFRLYTTTILLILFQTEAILPPPTLPFETLKQWNLLTYDFPWDWPSDDRNYYNPENVVATGIEVDDYRIFVATPRLFSAVPATLSTISRGGSGDSNILRAYPDWSHHTISQNAYNCSDIGLVSVYRIRIDSCNRLWALDAGVSRSLEDYEITCPPKILVYDLSTDRVVRRIDFPAEVIQKQSLFTNLIVDETTSRPENNCDDVFVYITDTVAPGIIVYDSEKDFTWRLSHPAMFPDPDFSESTIDGYKFTLMDGIVGLAFDPKLRQVYFQPLATDRLFSISTAALRAGPIDVNEELPVQLVGRKSSQGIGLGVSHYGSIIFSPFTETAVAEWNPRKNTQIVLAYDPDQIQFSADIKTTDRDPDYVYVLTSRFHRFFLKNLDVNDVNTRILRIKMNSYGGHRFPSFGAAHHGFNPFLSSGYGYSKPIPSTSGYHYPPAVTSTPHYSSSYKPSSYVHSYLSSFKPYKYESAGVFPKNLHNPFTSLNTGENPHLYNHQSLNHLNDDYNGLRFAKSISYNITTTH